ncbi:uncharacterized protein NPIL_655491 [Nephila pilipes]|uniref:Uncharacterized protein n=1 Tax=Nephila pilipes TaxID=299642 RepID=A0A8X6I3C4_NEPPI|nr:uncharacterized protein NPIL_655491 [Nephila pilipes]
MGHMEEVIESEEPDEKFLFCIIVFRPKSNSTPLRVVFDVNALTSSEKSLNCLQFNWCTIQDDLLCIMLKSRMHQLAFVADIKNVSNDTDRSLINLYLGRIDPYLLIIIFKTEKYDPLKLLLDASKPAYGAVIHAKSFDSCGDSKIK